MKLHKLSLFFLKKTRPCAGFFIGTFSEVARFKDVAADRVGN
jgi:hypothetical protein